MSKSRPHVCQLPQAGHSGNGQGGGIYLTEVTHYEVGDNFTITLHLPGGVRETYWHHELIPDYDPKRMAVLYRYSEGGDVLMLSRDFMYDIEWISLSITPTECRLLPLHRRRRRIAVSSRILPIAWLLVIASGAFLAYIFVMGVFTHSFAGLPANTPTDRATLAPR
jgi:hypothetical protein